MDDTTTDSAPTLDTFSSYDIFALLGLANISDEEKAAKVQEMQQIVIDDFLVNSLPSILTPEQQQELDKLVDENSDQEALLAKLVEFVPDLENKLFLKTLEFKKAFVMENLDLRLSINAKTKQLLTSTPTSEGGSLEDKVKRLEFIERENSSLTQAIALYSEEKWDEGQIIMAQLYDTTLDTIVTNESSINASPDQTSVESIQSPTPSTPSI